MMKCPDSQMSSDLSKESNDAFSYLYGTARGNVRCIGIFSHCSPAFSLVPHQFAQFPCEAMTYPANPKILSIQIQTSVLPKAVATILLEKKLT